MNFKRAVVFVLFLIVFAISGFPEINVFCVTETQEGRFLNFELVSYHENGKKNWEIQGKSANIFANIVKLDNIVANAYGEERNFTLKADKGEVDKETNDVELEKNVSAVTSDGATMSTDKLKWLAKQDRVVTQENIKIENGNMTTYAKGAEASKGFGSIELKKDVTVNVKNPAMVLTCTGPVSVDYAQNMAVFLNNVKVKDDQGELVAERMEVFFSKKNNDIIKVIAIGNVIIVRGENISYSERATYLAKENKVILEGNPKLEVFTDKETGLFSQPSLGAPVKNDDSTR